MTSPQSPAIHLVLIRHAESLHNRDSESFTVESGLTEIGWRQAHAVAGWLAQRYRADTVFSSALMRSQQTAEVIAARLGVPLSIDEGLAEAEFQYWDELPFAWETPVDSWNNSWQPNPETSPLYTSFRARVHESLAHLIADKTNATILAVTHGGTIGTLMRSLFGGHQIAVFTSNTGVTQFDWEANHWRLMFHNSTAHLDSLTAQRSTALAPAAPPAAPWTNGEAAAVILKHYERVAAARPREAPYPSDRDLREMVRLVAPAGNERLLDVATGSGAVALAFAPLVASVVGVDLSPAMLEVAEAARSSRGLTNVHFRLGELGALPLTDGSYDIITCHNLLHYAPDLTRLLSRLRRMLAPEGRLLIDEPLGSDDPVKRATLNAIVLRRDPGVSQIWSAPEIETALNGSGFRIRKSERYAVARELAEWLAAAAADDGTRSAVRAMIEAGLDADAAGLGAKRNRDGSIVFSESRIRVLAEPQAQPT